MDGRDCVKHGGGGVASVTYFAVSEDMMMEGVLRWWVKLDSLL